MKKSQYKSAMIPAKQFGLSLIELLVTMTIGMVLILGLATIFSSNKDTQVLQAELSDMDANARSALFSLRNSISHAGYPSFNYVVLDKPFLTPSDAASFTNPYCRDVEKLIRGQSGIANNVDKSTYDSIRDAITPAFMIDNPKQRAGYYGCSSLNQTSKPDTENMAIVCSTDASVGMANATMARGYNRFYISLTDGRRALLCEGNNGTGQPVAENIENMQILYGIKDSQGLSYQNATALTQLENAGSNPWSNVNSVLISILVRSERDLSAKKETKVFTLLDKKVTTPSDRRLYKVYTTTINLENRTSKTL